MRKQSVEEVEVEVEFHKKQYGRRIIKEKKEITDYFHFSSQKFYSR